MIHSINQLIIRLKSNLILKDSSKYFCFGLIYVETVTWAVFQAEFSNLVQNTTKDNQVEGY